MERLVDRYLRDEAPAQWPLHPNQHAYQAGKSVETAFHQLVVRVEKALDLYETALGVFLDIERVFNNTCYDTMCDALVSHGVTTQLFGGLGLTWRAAWLRRPSVILLLGLRYPEVSRGGVLSPLLWCLVVDDLITRLGGSRIHIFKGTQMTDVFLRWVNSQTRYQDSCSGPF
jgi:hypothetical protein